MTVRPAGPAAGPVPGTSQPSREIVDLVTGSWQAQALYAAAALGIPDEMAAGCRTSAEIAARTGSSPDGIRRLMRLLAAMSVFDGSEPQGYRLAPVSQLLRTGTPGSMRDMVVLYGEEFYSAWGAVLPALRTGTPGFDHALGASLRDYLGSTPGAGAKFQRAMNAGSTFFADVLDAFDFSGSQVVVDVAGGSGMLLSVILRAHPGMHGIVFDLPHMTPIAERHLDQAVGQGRYQAVAGDAFDWVPGGADVYLLSRVLQDWDDRKSAILLSNIRAAMPDTARLLIVERVIGDDGSRLLPLLWDMHLLMAAGGQERTLDGYQALLTRAGFRLESRHPLALETDLLVAAPSGREAWSSRSA